MTPPALSVRHGEPTPEELAALFTAVAAVTGGAAAVAGTAGPQGAAFGLGTVPDAGAAGFVPGLTGESVPDDATHPGASAQSCWRDPGLILTGRATATDQAWRHAPIY